MSQRAEIIALAAKEGMTNLNEVRSFYDNNSGVNIYDKAGKVDTKNGGKKKPTVGIYNDVLQMIKAHESFSPTAYPDGHWKDGRQAYSIGYGFNDMGLWPNLASKYTAEGKKMTREDADRRIVEVVKNLDGTLRKTLGSTTYSELSPGQKMAFLDTGYQSPVNMIKAANVYKNYGATLAGNMIGVPGYDGRNAARRAYFFGAPGAPSGDITLGSAYNEQNNTPSSAPVQLAKRGGTALTINPTGPEGAKYINNTPTLTNSKLVGSNENTTSGKRVSVTPEDLGLVNSANVGSLFNNEIPNNAKALMAREEQEEALEYYNKILEDEAARYDQRYNDLEDFNELLMYYQTPNTDEILGRKNPNLYEKAGPVKSSEIDPDSYAGWVSQTLPELNTDVVAKLERPGENMDVAHYNYIREILSTALKKYNSKLVSPVVGTLDGKPIYEISYSKSGIPRVIDKEGLYHEFNSTGSQTYTFKDGVQVHTSAPNLDFIPERLVNLPEAVVTPNEEDKQIVDRIRVDFDKESKEKLFKEAYSDIMDMRSGGDYIALVDLLQKSSGRPAIRFRHKYDGLPWDEYFEQGRSSYQEPRSILNGPPKRGRINIPIPNQFRSRYLLERNYIPEIAHALGLANIDTKNAVVNSKWDEKDDRYSRATTTEEHDKVYEDPTSHEYLTHGVLQPRIEDLFDQLKSTRDVQYHVGDPNIAPIEELYKQEYEKWKNPEDPKNKFDDGGPLELRFNFPEWARRLEIKRGWPVGSVETDNTYDYTSFFYENPKEALKILNGDPSAHFTDRYKTVYHPTFSIESLLSGWKDPSRNPLGLVGGRWKDQADGRPEFIEPLSSPVSTEDRFRYMWLNEPEGFTLTPHNYTGDRSEIYYKKEPEANLQEAVVTGKRKKK